jgi:hypothetical protein
LITDVVASPLPPDVLAAGRDLPQHLVSLSSVEDDGLEQELDVVWEIEPAARLFATITLPRPQIGRFDRPALTCGRRNCARTPRPGRRRCTRRPALADETVAFVRRCTRRPALADETVAFVTSANLTAAQSGNVEVSLIVHGGPCPATAIRALSHAHEQLPPARRPHAVTPRTEGPCATARRGMAPLGRQAPHCPRRTARAAEGAA